MSELPSERMDAAIEYLKYRKNKLLDEAHWIDEVIHALEASSKQK